MHPISAETIKFTKEFTRQEPIPEAGIKRALELMKSGRLHRYNTAAEAVSEISIDDCKTVAAVIRQLAPEIFSK